MRGLRAIVVLGLLILGTLAQAEFGSTYTTQDTAQRTRRAAIGVMSGGLSGRFGIDLQLNFTKQIGFLAGYGASTDFQSLFFGLRSNLIDWFVTPYVSGGYAQWYSAGRQKSVGKTTPGFVGERFLSENERNTGRFHESLLFGGIGLEYMHQSGDFSGAAVYLEALLLADLDDFVTEPTLGLGAKYYF